MMTLRQVNSSWSNQEKKKKKQLENSAGVVNVRSKRTTPSIYRDRGGARKSNPPQKIGEEKNKFVMIKGLF
jgi:hypothetical protein